jgi:hypothetical protein
MEEITYYRIQSGLAATDLSQPDYEYEYFKNVSGLDAGLTIDDYKATFYTAETGLANREDAEYQYFKTETSDTTGTKSLEDLKKIFFDMQ